MRDCSENESLLRSSPLVEDPAVLVAGRGEDGGEG